jgi:hypothetical protein
MDRRGGTGLRAGREHLAVAHGAALGARLVLGLGEPLHAERALLHDALAAHRDVRIQLLLERLGQAVSG